MKDREAYKEEERIEKAEMEALAAASQALLAENKVQQVIG